MLPTPGRSWPWTEGRRLLNPELLTTITERGVSEIISRDEFVRLLRSGRPLRLKMGFDPSRPDIHLGHVVGLRKLRQLQDLGHQVILIVGDWTAQIGDPSGQSATRPMLTHEQVMENAQSYLRQFFKVVDEDKTQVVQQSEWFGKFTLADVINLTGKFTVAQFLQRSDFAQRFADKRPIALTELLYPLLQAYDSVAIESDVEFGGTDQMFNLLVGRELQGIVGQVPQQCFLMPILVGTDGVQKMSKSLDNYVGVDEPPAEMFGKIMSVSDGLILSYFEYLTDVPQADLADMSRDLSQGSVNPMDYKKRLAWEITSQFHDPESADAAQAQFERVIQGGDLPDEIQEVTLEFLRGQGVLADGEARVNRLLVATGLVSSNAEAKRMVGQGAVEVVHQSGHTESVSPENPAMPVQPGDVVRVGKRRFVRLIES